MDVVELREFYTKPLGQMAQQAITKQLQALSRPAADQIIVSLGFGLPYQQTLYGSHERNFAFMLARQGVIHWPSEAPVRSALVDEVDLPLLESTVDLALVIHGLEFAESPQDMLQEIWRVMAPQGKLILVVPNRRGLWAASEVSPFGHGQPFSRTQVAGLLREAKFSPTQWRAALFTPPVKALIGAAPALEGLGTRSLPRFSGVIIVEAVKQVYAFSSGKRARRLVPRFRPVLLPAPHGMRHETDRG